MTELKPTKMKATIDSLWETGRTIIGFDSDEFRHPTCFAEIVQCENVIVGAREKGVDKYYPREVLIDDQIYMVQVIEVHHPADYSKMILLEVL